MAVKFTIAEAVPVSGYVPIAAFMAEEPTPGNTLILSDHSQNILANMNYQTYDGGDTLPTVDAEPRKWQLIVTDKLRYKDDPGRDTLLLPYQYQPRFDHYSNTNNPSGEIHICYPDGTIFDEAEYELEYVESPETESMYSSYWYSHQYIGSVTERYDRSLIWRPIPQASGIYRFRLLLPEHLSYQPTTYCVKYNKVRKTNNNYGHIVYDDDVVESHVEILNPKPVYDYTDDYTFSAGSMSLAGGSLIGSLSSCRVRRAEAGRMRVELPVADHREGWYPRIWRGCFKDSSNNEYYLPETSNGAWARAVDWAAGGNPALTDIGLVHEEAYAIQSEWITTKDRPLYITTAGYPTYIPYYIYDGFRYPAANVDTDSNLSKGINIYVNGRMIGNDQIADWDAWNGRIRLARGITPNDSVSVTYLYEQRYYTMQVPDLNPQVHHRTPSQYYNMPLDDSLVIGIDAGGTGVIWWWNSLNPSGVYDGTYNGFSSITTATYPVAPTTTITSTTRKLAEVSTYRRVPDATSSLIDARHRGGGIQADQFFILDREIKTKRDAIQPESIFYTDIGLYDGVGLKKDGVIIVEIPIAKLYSLRDSIYVETRGITQAVALANAVKVVSDEVRKNLPAGSFFLIVDENKGLWPTFSL
jgi:hypothetical protein